MQFSSSSGDGKKSKPSDPKAIIPDDFFDEEAESEKEFLEMASSLVNSTGLESLTTVKVQHVVLPPCQLCWIVVGVV
jgi:hypothetical protein